MKLHGSLVVTMASMEEELSALQFNLYVEKGSMATSTQIYGLELFPYITLLQVGAGLQQRKVRKRHPQ